MTFTEFLQGSGEERAVEYIIRCSKKSPIPAIVHSRLWKLLKIYFVTGGLPEVVEIFNRQKEDLYNALHLVREKQTNLILAYEADMAKHSGKPQFPFAAFKDETFFKLYFFDIGILGAIGKLSPKTILDYRIDFFDC